MPCLSLAYTWSILVVSQEETKKPLFLENEETDVCSWTVEPRLPPPTGYPEAHFFPHLLCEPTVDSLGQALPHLTGRNLGHYTLPWAVMTFFLF